MIVTIAENIGAVLTDSDITSEIGSNKIFWELAEENTEYPFSTYVFEAEGYGTKERMIPVKISVFVYAETLNEVSRIASVIRDTVTEKHRWHDRGAKPGYTDTEAKSAYVHLKFETKINNA
ncbi:hypothetical protein [Mesonia aquimarina]|uniref:hypothetical protein n=1 Tax=Mesonia aquimarina TaxID=1504967 RepID=UPI000EF61BB4|nr:hypothetical protein [Mesonia aquimarina]